MSTATTELVYLRGSGLELAVPSEDPVGLVVVNTEGLRLGEVGDVVIDVHERRPRLVSVVSGGILGLATSESLVPVEAVTRSGDRLRVESPGGSTTAPAGGGRHTAPDTVAAQPPHLASFAAAYAAYGVAPFWRS